MQRSQRRASRDYLTGIWGLDFMGHVRGAPADHFCFPAFRIPFCAGGDWAVGLLLFVLFLIAGTALI